MRIAGEPTDKTLRKIQKGGRKVRPPAKRPTPNSTAISPSLWKLWKTAGFPHRKTNIPQPVQAGIVVCSGFQWVFHPFPSLYYGCLIWFLKTILNPLRRIGPLACGRPLHISPACETVESLQDAWSGR